MDWVNDPGRRAPGRQLYDVAYIPPIQRSQRRRAYPTPRGHWEQSTLRLSASKKDGTAKGGVVMGISDQFQIPVKYIGVGEGLEDLQLFNAAAFVGSFFS